MWFFKRKKRSDETPVAPPICMHKWKDFPWYITYTCNGRNLEVNIKEPYVCIYCKDRQDKNLMSFSCVVSNVEDRDKTIEEIKEKYKEYLQPKAIVEDMVNDFQMVDRQWLEFAERLSQAKAPVLHISNTD